MDEKRIEAQARKRGVRFRKTWLLIAGLIAVMATAYMLPVLKASEQVEVHLYGSQALLLGSAGSFQVRVIDAVAESPVAGATVDATLSRFFGSEVVWEGRVETDEHGTALLKVDLPEDTKEGRYRLVVKSRARGGSSQVFRHVEVERGLRIALATDRPLYQPGQMVRIRALARDIANGKPVPEEPMSLEIFDPEGDLVYRRSLETSEFGIAEAAMPLARQVRKGKYELSLSAGEMEARHEITVDRYRPPPFIVSIEKERIGFRTLKIDVGARYTFGEPLDEGDVRIVVHPKGFEDEHVLVRESYLCPEGNFGLEIDVFDLMESSRGHREGLVISVEVSDGAGHTETIARRIGIPGAPVSIAPRGSDRTWRSSLGRGGLRIELEESTYRAGEEMDVRVGAAQGDAPVIVDLVHEGATVASGFGQIENGEGRVAIHVPEELFGPVILHAYQVVSRATKRDRRVSDFEIMHSGDKNVRQSVDSRRRGAVGVLNILPREDLSLKVSRNEQNPRPGDTIRLDVDVQSTMNEPVRAALGISGVDVASLAAADLHQGSNGATRGGVQPIFNMPLSRTEAVLTTPPPFDVRDEVRRAERTHRLSMLAVFGVFLVLAYSLYLLGPVIVRAVLILLGRRRFETEEEPRDPIAPISLLAWWAVAPCVVMILPFVVAFLVLGIDDYLSRVFERSTMSEIAVGVVFVSTYLVASCFFWWAIRRASRRKEDIEGLLRRVPAAAAVLLSVPALALIVGVVLSMSHEGSWMAVSALYLTIPFFFLLFMIGGGALAVVRGQGGILAAVTAMLFPFLLWFTVLVLVFMVLFGDNIRALFSGSANVLAGEPIEETVLGQHAPRDAFGRSEDGPSDFEAEDTAIVEAPRVRRYFPETLLWMSEVVTDESGRATIEVPLADSITTWRFDIDAITTDGSYAETEAEVRAFQPFFIEPRLPAVMTQNDRIMVPVAVHNHLDSPQSVRLEIAEAPWFRLHGSSEREVELSANEVRGVSLELEAIGAGEHALEIRAFAGDLADAVERKVDVRPDGVMVESVAGGRLGREPVVTSLDIPPDAIEGGSDLFVKIYPTALGQIVEGMEGMLRMPTGCFEQSTSAAYPNLLVLDYLERTGLSEPSMTESAERYLIEGYQRLLYFEHDGGGFTYFGRGEPESALTAYALMILSDMARVHPVEPDVILRNGRKLAKMQGADGRWPAPSRRQMPGAAGARGHLADLRASAYATWALARVLEAESDGRFDEPLDRDVQAVAERGLRKLLPVLDGRIGRRASEDPYLVALLANALVAMGHERADEALKKLAGMAIKGEDGAHWSASGGGVTDSRGSVLAIETTALAVQALASSRRHQSLTSQGLGWLVKKRDARGSWGTTQSTVQVLKALVTTATPHHDGSEDIVEINVDQETIARVNLDEDGRKMVHLVSLTEHALPEVDAVSIEGRVGSDVAWQVVSRHYLPRDRLLAEGSEDLLSLSTDYGTTSLSSGESTTATARVSWDGDEPLLMPTMRLGVPPGFEVDTHDLDDLVEEELIANWELEPGALVIYMEVLGSGEEVELEYGVWSSHPGRVKSPASSAYAYYTPSTKAEAAPISLTVF